jgi:DNA-binding SARP family transcriptional activator
MDFRILGALEVLSDGRALDLGGQKHRALLALLLIEANRVVSRDRLIDALWEEEPPETAVKALQVYISQLRKQLGKDRLETKARGYMLRVEPDELDLARFQRLQAEGALREALSLWRGPPLADFGDRRFAQAEIARLEELRLACLEEQIEKDLDRGRYAALVGELESLVNEHPLREQLRGQLMLCLYRSGRQAEALEVYQSGRSALVEELGIEPGRELRELHQAILQQDPQLDVGAAAERGVEPARSAFVGRERELAELLAGLDDACAGTGRLFLLVGEPGIGKSRLAEELIARAGERGARVLVGRCWEAGGAPAYWPWLQSLRAYVKEAPADVLRPELGAGAADLAGILPELRERIPGLPEAPSAPPEGARFRLFEAATSLLLSATSDRPLVLVLDDLHAADEPSLLLLRFVAREIAASRVLVVCAYRDVDPALGDPLGSALAELVREPHSADIPLAGLSKDDVAEYVELSTGTEPAAWLVEAIHSETEGNPLFMAEVVRLLAGEAEVAEPDAQLHIPASVRAVIGRRVGRLSESCRDLLVSASVMGREFGLDALAQLSGLPSRELLDVLDEAMAERVVGDVPASPGRLRFGHALIRDTLYEGLTPARRMRLHHEAAAALEAAYASDLEPHLAELAQHYFAAAPAGVADRAIEYARRAADRAAAQVAHEEAARLYRMALDALAIRGRGDEEARCGLLLALGEAHARAGDAPAAKEAFLAAADIARRLRLPDALGRAALGFEGRFVWPRATDERTIPLLDEAIQVLEGDSALRVGVLARFCGAVRAEPWRQDEREAISKEAVASARRLGDPATLAYALEGRYAVLMDATPRNPEERLAVGAEMAELGERSGVTERAWSGHLAQLVVRVERGDRTAADAELERITELAEALRQPAQLQMTLETRALFALLDGRFEAAEALIDESVTLGERTWIGSLLSVRTKLWMLRRQQGGYRK